MNHPADQSARSRFATELDQNFSVVAAAGSGKTRAITDRIVALAQSSQALDRLPQLVVVTYTNRAANEMQQRARQQILNASVGPRVIAAFNRAFFGTIHSFCVKLLSNYGHYLGLPPQMELVDGDDELWNDFVQRQQTIGKSLSDRTRKTLFRHVEVRKLMELGRCTRMGEIKPFSDEPSPVPNFKSLFAYQAKSANSIGTVDRMHKALGEFKNLLQRQAEFVPLPQPSCRAKDCLEIWSETFKPFRDWLNRAALAVVSEVECAYREFRLTRGVLTYDDQVALAHMLFRHPEASRRVREKNFRVLLDEAQDTSPLQFAVLLEASRPPDANKTWPNESLDPPRPGHFSMVGDFQQSIWGHQADLKNYQRVHDALLAAGGEELEFSVTFRLDQENLELVKENFRKLLSDTDGQVRFVELSPRPSILPGQIIRIELARPDSLPADAPDRRKAVFEATEVARWIQKTGLRNLRAQTWSDVAILCPRKAWFEPLSRALRSEGINVQIQSDKEVKGDNPAYAWLTALLTVMTEPYRTYETVGVLREVFGVSDHDLAIYSEAKGHRFDLSRSFEGNDIVSTKLKFLSKVRRALQPLSLFTAVDELIKTVQLRERLLCLPQVDLRNLEEELDRLLALAASAEASSTSLYEFAKNLRLDFSTQREPPATFEGAIQLITGQKAKGSEWEAVIVPFLAREVSFANDKYPRLLPASLMGELLVALSEEDITPEIEGAAERVQKQEMERLLYVALTRAKHTLVLVQDLALFPRKSGRPPSKSQMKWLRYEIGGDNANSFNGLSQKTTRCAKTEARHEAEQKARNVHDFELPGQAPHWTTKTKENAHDFVRRVNPSKLKEELRQFQQSISEQPMTVSICAGRFDNPATLYGRWWHRLFERIQWDDDPANWNQIFKAALVDAPERERAEQEWNMFRTHTSGPDDFRRRLAGDRFNARNEMPFLLRVNSIALEGIIDLVLFDSAAKCGLIVDWKTNDVDGSDPKNIEELRKLYRSQIATYWKAMVAITRLNVEAGLYSTCLGEFLPYSTDELEKEWTRLQKLSFPDFQSEVEGD